MFSCCCSQWWWVSSSTFLHSSWDFLILPAQTGKNGLRGLDVAGISLRVHPVFEQWNRIMFLFSVIFFPFRLIFIALKWYLLILCWKNIKQIALEALFCQESWMVMLRVLRVTTNLFCRWPARRKTQSPWSLYRQSCGEQAEAFMSTSWNCSITFSIACLSKMFVLIMYLSSLQAFSDCWAESPPPPGGTRAHYTVGTRRLVQFSCNSLPVGNCSFYDGTFLLLTRSVVRPSVVLFSKCMLHTVENNCPL